MTTPDFTGFMASFERHLEQTYNFQSNFGIALGNFAEQAQAKEAAFQAALESMANKASAKDSTANLPERFEGAHRSQELAKQFITGLESYFRLMQTDALTDERKINIAISRLKGAANTWIDPYESDLNKIINERGNAFLRTWEGFRREFLSRFGDSMPTQHAYEQLHELKQTGSVADYTTRFRHLYEIYDPAANSRDKYYAFRQGLKRPIRAAIATRGDEAPGEDDFEAYVRAAISTDEETFEHNRTKTNLGKFGPRLRNHSDDYRYTRPQTTAGRHTPAHPEPMDLSATQNESKPDESRNPVTDKERAYRRANNLCFYCGGKHRIASCPNKSPDRSFRSN